jgi:hypothetical protein
MIDNGILGSAFISRNSNYFEGNLIPVQVVDIILDDSHPQYKKFGENDSVVMIYFNCLYIW